MIQSDLDPIVAVATAPGRGGIGIVRLSGRDLAPVIDAVLARALPPRHATLSPFLDRAGRALDQGIALLFPAPHSYTGETVLELQAHGGPVLLRMLLARCLEAGRAIGLRIAEPDEFTRRAFLNDRLDLAQAEAVADLIDAATEAAARGAARSCAGEFSRAVHALTEALVDLRTLVEATLDFPEEEIDFLAASDARGRLAGIRAQLDELVLRSRQGALLRSGLLVVLVGAPNVGKSSLLNALAGEEVAIVTPYAGTTRDRIEKAVAVDGIPLHIVDTAGVRPTEDPIELMGIERTLQEVARADLIVRLMTARMTAGAVAGVDTGSHATDAADDAVLARVHQHAGRTVPLVTVINKIDLTGESPRCEENTVWLSAKTSAGIDGLRARLRELAGWQSDTSGETVFLARERHLDALAHAREHLAAAAAHASESDRALDLFAEELRLAGNALGEITGEITADDLLGRIFSRFCIGK